MASRNAYIFGGITAAAVVVAFAVAWKVRQDSTSQRADSKSADPSPSIDERAVAVGSGSAPSEIPGEARDVAQPEAVGGDLVLHEDGDAKTVANAAPRTVQVIREPKAKAEPSIGVVASASAADQTKPSVTAQDTSTTQVSSKVEEATATTTLATSTLEDSVVVVSKEQVKLEDSYVQVAKPETTTAAAVSSSEPEPAATPKRQRNRKSKKEANVKSPTGTANLLDTSLDISVSSEGLASPEGVTRAGVGAAGHDNPQDDSNGGGEGEGGDASATASPPAKDLSAIAKSRGGPKSAAAAAAVKEIQSSVAATSSATKKKPHRNRNKSSGGSASKQASPHH
jgi:hypothetical protein